VRDNLTFFDRAIPDAALEKREELPVVTDEAFGDVRSHGR